MAFLPPPKGNGFLCHKNFMNKIDLVFKDLKEKSKVAVIPFVTAGFPSMEDTFEIVTRLDKEGASIIELGVPCLDPIADGPVLEDISIRSCKMGTSLKGVLNLCKSFRISAPIVLLVYFNQIYKYGIEDFVQECGISNISGLVIPDLPYEEREILTTHTSKSSLSIIPFVAPTSNDRMAYILSKGNGFVYCVSRVGITGTSGFDMPKVISYLKKVKSLSPLPIAIGFGVSSKEQVESLAPYCHGVIIGTAFMALIEEGKKEEAYGLIRNLISP